jgi:Asp-tRNA(Asn)/Glu-tRNA(Gln) amidotransferase B subunit
MFFRYQTTPGRPKSLPSLIDGVLKVHLARNQKVKIQKVELEPDASDQKRNDHYNSSGWGINE